MRVAPDVDKKTLVLAQNVFYEYQLALFYIIISLNQ